MKEYFCWRCNRFMPFLDEEEWQQISPLLPSALLAIKGLWKKLAYDRRREVTLKFEALTGMPDIPPETISHHRLKNWGQECPECGYLLRTPTATFCAKCGWRPKQVSVC